MYIYLFIICLVFAVPTYADINSNEYAKCAAMVGDLQRLECFDNLAKEKKLDKPKNQVIDNVGKWRTNISVNPVDDSKTVVASLIADSGKSRWGEPIGLVVRCMSNNTDMYINWSSFLGMERTNVLTRIGSDKAETKSWSLSTDNQSIFYPNSPISYLKRMMGSNKFLAQVTPYSENPITAVFDTTGMKRALKHVREECGW